MSIFPVILSGGSGTRLWPLSRASRPKQFLTLTGQSSLFQQALTRFGSRPDFLNPIIVANDEHRFLVAEQCREVASKPTAILLEPVSRNTAPAICAAALKACELEADPVLLVLPADHLFADLAELHIAVSNGLEAVERGRLVTFGVVPDRPETGYGYIKAGNGSATGAEARLVQRFVEKPNLDTAKQYVSEGSYYWNSGMFMFRASVFIEELEKHNKDMLEACRAALLGAKADLDFVRLDADAFSSSPSDSIDYAVMEKTMLADVVPLRAGWNDVGAWSAVWDVSSKDEAGNAMRGDVVLQRARDCYVYSDHRLVAVLGVEDLVVVETADAVLIGRKDCSQDVKGIVDALKVAARAEVMSHREVQRPWGSYDAIGNGPRYQVKRITVKPGAKLSVQMHHHRAEHWVVVSGTAKVRIGEMEKLVTENQSVYIPIGDVHSLENPGKVPLELIEVQSGVYLGEDDIVRFEDRYGRA